MPKRSIITINYNNFEGLKRTIESVINQTYKDFEYIIIDGGSTDGSATYIESQSTHFDYWVSEPDKGIYSAMNKGILKATGEYLLFLNSGDHFYDLEVLEKNHQFVKDYDLVYFDLQVIDTGESFIKNYPEKLPFSYFVKDTLPHPATFIKSSLFDQLGLYDEELKIVSDWKFFIFALYKYNCSYLKIETILSTFYLDGFSSNAENKNLIATECALVLNTYFSGFVEVYNQFFGLKKNSFKSKKITKSRIIGQSWFN